MLYFLESLRMPLFPLHYTRGSASEQCFWHGMEMGFLAVPIVCELYSELGFS